MLGLWSNFPGRQSLKNLNLSGAQLDILKQNVVTLVAAIYAVKTEASVSHKNWCHSHSKVEFAQGFFHPTTAQEA